MESIKVSNNMLERMPIYLNYLKSLQNHTQNISATKIANALGLGEVSVRKDLAKVSDGGRCKLGYVCGELIHDIETFLDVKHLTNVVIVGKGEMVQSLLGYEGFFSSGINVLGAFDMDCQEQKMAGDKIIYPVSALGTFCVKYGVEIAMLMVPADAAQMICDQVVESGVKAIWNFTPTYLKVSDDVVVQNENMTTSIIKLKMQIKEKNEERC